MHRFLPRRAARALAAGLCLTVCLALGACGGRDSTLSEGSAESEQTEQPQSSASSSAPRGPVVSRRTDQPTPGATSTAPAADPTTSAPAADPATSAPAADPTPWTAPSLKFYNENWDYWYQDDSVTNQDSITSQGNLEGYRTYSGRCVGFIVRDISETTHMSSRSDDEKSASLAGTRLSNVDSFAETSREKVSLVRDDGGTMEGYNITYTGTYTWADGTTAVTGYRFARAVSAAGLNFAVMLMCVDGEQLSPDQWHEILSGIRIEGLTAGAMGQ